jgi:hypothetical protein
MIFPSGLQATLQMAPVWPSKVVSSLPDDASHSFTVLPREPDATVFPSGLQATL